MRNTTLFTVTREGRDFGKQFKITEMSAWDGEKLANEVLKYLSRGVEIPDSVVEMGCRGLATFGTSIFMLLEPAEADAFTKKLLATVKRVITTDTGATSERPLVAEDIDDYQTIIEIKDQVFKLNFDFLANGAK